MATLNHAVLIFSNIELSPLQSKNQSSIRYTVQIVCDNNTLLLILDFRLTSPEKQGI